MSDEKRRTLPEILEEIRVSRNLTQNGLAEAAGVSKKTMSRLMNGMRPDPDTLIIIAESLHLNPLDLFAIAYLPNNRPSSRGMIVREIVSLLEAMPDGMLEESVERIRFDFELYLKRTQGRS